MNARARAESRSFIPNGWQEPGHLHISAATPSSLARAWIRSGATGGYEPVPVWDAGIAGGDVTHYATMPSPSSLFESKVSGESPQKVMFPY